MLGGKTLEAAAPIQIMPLFVKAGSIVPMGPHIEFATEKSDAPMELRIYQGADAKFTLYEDENDNYNYEKGQLATIEFNWDDTKKTLTIADRKGEFPGMLKERTFAIVLVNENHGNGIGICSKPDKLVNYSGTKLEAKF